MAIDFTITKRVRLGPNKTQLQSRLRQRDFAHYSPNGQKHAMCSMRCGRQVMKGEILCRVCKEES